MFSRACARASDDSVPANKQFHQSCTGWSSWAYESVPGSPDLADPVAKVFQDCECDCHKGEVG